MPASEISKRIDAAIRAELAGALTLAGQQVDVGGDASLEVAGEGGEISVLGLAPQEDVDRNGATRVAHRKPAEAHLPLLKGTGHR